MYSKDYGRDVLNGIGLELGLTADTLDSINKSNQGSVDECFRVTLKKWLQTVEPQQRSWYEIGRSFEVITCGTE